MPDGVEDDWLEGGEDAPEEFDSGSGSRGEICNKSRIQKMFGLAPLTLDRYVKEGAPVISRGSRRQGWKIDSAAMFKWCIDYAIGRTGKGSVFDVAKTREKEATAKLKEIQIAERERELICIDDVVNFYSEELSVVRQRMLQIPTQISGITAEQLLELQEAITDALAALSGDKRETWKGEPESEQDDDGIESQSSEGATHEV